MDDSPPCWLDEALAQAAEGQPVFPYGLDKHDILVRWGTESTTDPAVIRHWAARWPRSRGYGLALRADTYVFDADGPEAVQWCEDNLPTTRVVETGRQGGGSHYYLRVPDGRRLRLLNTRLGLLFGVPKLDGKTKGGYVVGPGSLHHSGATYAVSNPAPIAMMYAGLADLIGDRRVVHIAEQEGLTRAEQAAFEANAVWGIELRPEAAIETLQVVDTLKRYLRMSDERWADAFLSAGTRLGAHVATGAVTYAECVDVLDQLFEECDDWQRPSSNVPRSIRRGVAYGARTERERSL